jgi:DNA-binding PadR family transcriptional regulator
MWHGFGCDPGDHARAGRSGGWFDAGFGPWFWGGRGRKGFGFRGGRFFEQGDLKYVILQLLSEKPRHGYDVIKVLEERFGGAYAPSAGTVYPTLTLLEDLGYASVSVEEGGKKIYSITDAGRKYLDDNRSAVDDIFDRIADIGSAIFSDAMASVNGAFKDIARATYGGAARYRHDASAAERVREILERAAKEIEEVLGQSRRPGESGTRNV